MALFGSSYTLKSQQNFMLTRFRIQNFKSLVDFEMNDMKQFVCLTGLNGAGKTSVIQAIDFVSHLVADDLDRWFEDRDWEKSDVKSKLTSKKNIEFEVELLLPAGKIEWEGTYNPTECRCTEERVHLDGVEVLSLIEGQLKTGVEQNMNLKKLKYQGSIFSFVDLGGRWATELVEFFEQLKSLEMLSPHKIRIRSRVAKDVGTGGEKVAGFIHQLKSDEKQQLVADLRRFYPQLTGLKTIAQRGGGTQLSIQEETANLETEARHVNDGLLRILALVAQMQTGHRFLLFDEIENGINPELAHQLMDFLLHAKQQIMVTTHNAVLLNYLSDEQARESVYFLYRTNDGDTKAVKFFEIPEIAKKLNILGPGEVFLDTSLTGLSEKLAGQGQEEQ